MGDKMEKNIRIVKLSEIFLNPDNPRVIKDEKFKRLVKSIKEFPEMLNLRPIVVNKNMMVLGGNMRLKACKEAGLKELPILVAENLSENQEKEFIIKDNLCYGEWNYEAIENEWEMDLICDWGVDLPKMKEQEVFESLDTDKQENIIIVECIGEVDQKNLFDELKERGYKCKLMM